MSRGFRLLSPENGVPICRMFQKFKKWGERGGVVVDRLLVAASMELPNDCTELCVLKVRGVLLPCLVLAAEAVAA